MKHIVSIFILIKNRLGIPKTWMMESAFVITVLAVSPMLTAALTHDWRRAGLEAIAALAVYFSFKHASVAERMREADEANARSGAGSTTECAPKLNTFFIYKEVLWVAFFSLSGAWSALIGCGIFLLYPVWRAAYRKSVPRA